MTSLHIGADLERFRRHVPTILVKQLIGSLLHQFIYEEESGNGRNSSNESADTSYRHDAGIPSIVRFHGALLFVDISGFTVLSQRLQVDELRVHINGYFSKILDIVEKYGGDVVKFAGDAMFIVFQTPHSTSGRSTIHTLYRLFD